MTAPTHTRAEVEQLAAKMEQRWAERRAEADRVGKFDEAWAPIRARQYTDEAEEYALIATALRAYAASIGAEPLGWAHSYDSGPDGLFSQSGMLIVFQDRGVAARVAREKATFPVYLASPTYREGELSGIEKARVYLDLDGVMADFDAHFPAMFGVDHKGLADDVMWEIINAHPSYFRDMPPCAGAVEFFRSIEHLDPIILTACPKSNYVNAAMQKREWVREHLSRDIVVLPVMGGRHKPLFMHAPGDILIDDFEKNIDAWRTAGGVGILHSDFETTAASLRRALAKET